MKDWLPYQLDTIRNLTDIASLVYNSNKKLPPTILELLYQEVQTVLDENCIETERPDKMMYKPMTFEDLTK